jgi:predicted lipid-binding transport protein (Tim44 family)
MEKKTMNRRTLPMILAGAVLLICAAYLCVETAEAARLGGGRSFGSRPSYQRSAPAPSAPQPGIRSPAPQAPAGMPSGMGRWGGMLGGLVMGSMIGSLLFGGGMHAGGGFGLLDMLVIGGGLFLLLRFLRSRRAATEAAVPGGQGALFERVGARGGWGGLSGESPSGAPDAAAPAIPPDFDADDFLKGARLIYTRLQSSWDRRDLKDIRQFTSPEVCREIEDQAAQDPHPGKTELLLITPRLLEVKTIEGRMVASVLYDVMLREDAEEAAKQVREIWHFSRPQDQPAAFWTLEGIQQVDG